MTEDLEDRVQRVEYAIWGLTGDNGLKSEVRSLRHELRQGREDERRRREKLAETARNQETSDRRERRRNLLTAVGISITALAAFATAILQIVGV